MVFEFVLYGMECKVLLKPIHFCLPLEYKMCHSAMGLFDDFPISLCDTILYAFIQTLYFILL